MQKSTSPKNKKKPPQIILKKNCAVKKTSKATIKRNINLITVQSTNHSTVAVEVPDGVNEVKITITDTIGGDSNTQYVKSSLGSKIGLYLLFVNFAKELGKHKFFMMILSFIGLGEKAH
ncbi:MAG TPA: hypothetical protein PKD91_10730 [Bacteroidia bacterium]|nr:hypothetical protein [Bacteroidia bacterium]